MHLSALERDLPLGREQLEALARTVLDRTVAATRTVLLDAQVPPEGLSAVVLVGGASSMPLVATLLHGALGIAPIAIEQPELVVAEGSLAITRPSPAVAITPGVTDAAGAADLRPSAPGPRPANGPRHRRKRWTIAGAVATTLALLAAVGMFFLGPDGPLSTINPFEVGKQSHGPSQSAGGGSEAAEQVAAAGKPTGETASPGSTPTTTRQPGTASPSTTKAGPTRSPTTATEGVPGPQPSPRSTSQASTAACENAGLRMTRIYGSEEKVASSLAQGMRGGYRERRRHVCRFAEGWIIGFNTKAYRSDATLRYQWRLELRHCGGGLIVSKDAGPAEKVDNTVTDKTAARSSSPTQAVVRLSLEFRVDGTVWTASGTATSPCISIP